jgi:hypothetical protein
VAEPRDGGNGKGRGPHGHPATVNAARAARSRLNWATAQARSRDRPPHSQSRPHDEGELLTAPAFGLFVTTVALSSMGGAADRGR